MTVTFFSSILNHHQISLCEALCAMPEISFTFVQAIDLTDERRAQGFSAIDAPYVVNGQQEPERAYRLCMDSDVVIAGVIDQSWVNQRVANGKLTFAYKERFCKDMNVLLHPAFWKNGYFNYFRFRNKNFYLLCASAYTARDTRVIFPRPNKKFKWGYFPKISRHENDESLLNKKDRETILWVGRFIDLKHPEVCIALARQLKAEERSFRLNIVGIGPMREQLEQMIAEYGLSDCVHILGQMSPEQARRQMRESGIFLFTSDRKEGWGAVLNEAMSEGCACIASKQAGSTDFLIRDGENGFSYDCEDIETLIRCVTQLLDDPARLRTLQLNALHTIRNTWNAEVAAARLMQVCKDLLCAQPPQIFHDGPVSIA